MNSFILSLLTAVLALGPCPNPATETCLIGGSTTPCTGMQCPPCWIPHTTNNWACYQKSLTGNTSECLPWNGMVDITNPPSSCAIPTKPPTTNTTICPTVSRDTCFQGSHLEFPCKGKECPPAGSTRESVGTASTPSRASASGKTLSISAISPPTVSTLPKLSLPAHHMQG
ncbi:hypothetical protein DSO57_1013314 [Entomophthora muscae]|uniref:Uncharacterized protein n=1 Tax=Entomophthora muscae TaxID=34485 RepID=A0ACC2UFG9_9FUNG|nr:hypothetical protein DSO57_1013314 [Entomophthora muscae]